MTFNLGMLFVLVQNLEHILGGSVDSDLGDASQDVAFGCLLVSHPTQGKQAVEFGPLPDSFEDV